MNDDELSDEIIPRTEAYIAWLRSRPPGAEVCWHSDHMTHARPWDYAWVEVLCDDLQAEVPWPWVWTITWGMDDDPDDDNGGHPPDLEKFEYPPDRCVYRIWDHAWRGAGRPNPEIAVLATEIGVPLTPAQVAVLNDALASSPTAAAWGLPGWSAACISDALSFWAETYAGRSDLRFVWDPSGTVTPLVLRQHHAARRGMSTPVRRISEDEGAH